MTDPWDEEFDPSATARSVLRWALASGAETLGDAYDLLEQLAMGNDVPEVLGEDGSIEGVRDELEWGLETVGPDASLGELL